LNDHKFVKHQQHGHVEREIRDNILLLWRQRSGSALARHVLKSRQHVVRPQFPALAAIGAVLFGTALLMIRKTLRESG
jgi:hypothetical protein